MLEQSQQSVQGQTSQPNPQTQVPQNPQETDLQNSIDQQALEATNSVIQVPRGTGVSRPEQTATTTQPIVEDSSFLPDLHVGTSLLIGSFLLAITLVLLLARLAYRHQKTTTAAVEEVDSPPSPEAGLTPEVPKKNKSERKQTRRQRRRQK